MNYRSTNVLQGGSHTGGALVVGVEAGSGIELNATSSGNAPTILPAGDEANKGLTIAAKGTGTLTLGSSANQPLVITSSAVTFPTGGSFAFGSNSTVVLSTGSVLQVGSTAPFAGFVRFTSTDVATPNFNSTAFFGIVSTYTLPGINSSHYVFANPTNLSTAIVLSDVWAGSTAGSVNLKWNKISTITISASTATIRFLVVRF